MPDEACVFLPPLLYAQLLTLTDKRGRHVRQYTWAPLLAIAILAKLCAHNQVRAIAHWAHLRTVLLGQVFGLARLRMPHHTRWCRIFAHAVDPDAVTRGGREWLIPPSESDSPARD